MSKPIYYGPQGGKYSDPAHKVAYKEEDNKVNPWEMSASQWLTHKKIHEPWIAEISPYQYAKLSDRAKRQYDEKRNKEWGEANKGKEEWAKKVYEAYKAGKFKLGDKNVHSDVSIVLSRENENIKKESFDDAVKNNHIKDLSSIKVGDKVFHVIYRRYGIVTKVGKKSIGLKFEDNTTVKAKAGLIDHYSYNDLQEKYGIKKSLEYTMEKANLRGGKYKQRIAKPGGGYRYIYDDEQSPMNTLTIGQKTVSRGIHKNNDGTFTAMTYTQSKDFKTKKGAEKWLKDRGLNPDGSKIENMQKAYWPTSHKNDLPDSAFLYIEAGGKKDESGKTVPRELRHFPYRNMEGKLDLPHLRNAIARIPQSKCGLSTSQKTALQDKARKLLEGKKEMEKSMFCIEITEEEFEKADRGGKYVRKVPKKGGGYVYFYEDGKYEIGGKKDRKAITGYIDKVLGSSEGKSWLGQLNRLSPNDRNKAFNKLAGMAVKQSGKEPNFENKQTALTHLKQKYSVTYNKSLDAVDLMEDFLKATIESNALPVIGKGQEQGDQSLAGKGKSSGNPGNGSGVIDKGVTKPPVKKLSEDDEVDEANMKTHKKPIETSVRKSLPLSQPHDIMAYEVALRKSQMTREPVVTLSPGEPLQKSVQVVRLTSDEEAVNLINNNDFYKASLSYGRLDIPLLSSQKCRYCSNTFSKAITVCPHCGN